MTDERAKQFPLGAALTTDILQSAPYDALAELRSSEPVSWVACLNGWLVTRRDLAIEVLRDADTFTVDDPRFTTAAVLGTSMLSLDGSEHARRRGAFTEHFRPSIVRDQFEALLTAEARSLVLAIADDGAGELRTGLAGPLAVRSISLFLGLGDLDPAVVLAWYRTLADAIVARSQGLDEPAGTRAAFDELRRAIDTAAKDPTSLVAHLHDHAPLTPNEIVSELAVVMFGAIETSEGMTANCLWHLLQHPEALAAVRTDRALVAAAVEESLRLEPAAAVVDRYSTRATTLAGADIGERELVTVSLLGANRDPANFSEPDRFHLDRANARQHLSFVQGPHGCIGLHLARLETNIAMNAALDLLPDLSLDPSLSSPPEGLIFRKPASVATTWR